MKSGANCFAVVCARSQSSFAWSAASSACSALPRAVAVLSTINIITLIYYKVFTIPNLYNLAYVKKEDAYYFFRLIYLFIIIIISTVGRPQPNISFPQKIRNPWQGGVGDRSFC